MTFQNLSLLLKERPKINKIPSGSKDQAVEQSDHYRNQALR